MADLGDFLKKGVALPLGNDRRNIKLRIHASGGVVFELGNETVLMSPRQTYELAVALLKAAKVNVVEHAPDRAQQLRA